MSKFSARTRIAAAAASVIAFGGVTAACGGGGSTSGQTPSLSTTQPSQTPSETPSRTPSAPATPTTGTLDQWRGVATGEHFQAIGEDLNAMAEAGDNQDATAMRTAGQALHNDAQAYLDDMNAITPPPEVAAAHQHLVDAAYDLHDAGQAAADGNFTTSADYLGQASTHLTDAQADLPDSAALGRLGHTLSSLASVSGTDASLAKAAR